MYLMNIKNKLDKYMNRIDEKGE